MATVEKRGKRYIVRWQDPDGERKSKGGFASKAAADAFRRTVEDTVASGERWKPGVSRTAPVLTEVMAAWITHLSTTKSPRTVYNRGAALDNLRHFLEEDIPRRAPTVQDLSRALLERFYLWLGRPDTARKGVPRTLDTRKKNVEIVQQLWDWVVDHDTYGEHTERVRRLKDLPSSPSTPTTAPTWEEMDATTAAAATLSGDPLYPIALALMRFTGLRISQVTRLVVGDFDVEAETLRVRGELGKSRQERRGRIVPVSRHLLALLRPRLLQLEPEAFVVPTGARRAARSRAARAELVRDAWAATPARPEIWKGRPDHCFRKGLVSGLKRAGADSDAIEVLVGHSLGLRGVYTDPRAMPLVVAVGLIPPPSEAAAAAIKHAVTTSLEGEQDAHH